MHAQMLCQYLPLCNSSALLVLPAVCNSISRCMYPTVVYCISSVSYTYPICLASASQKMIVCTGMLHS